MGSTGTVLLLPSLYAICFIFYVPMFFHFSIEILSFEYKEGSKRTVPVLPLPPDVPVLPRTVPVLPCFPVLPPITRPPPQSGAGGW